MERTSVQQAVVAMIVHKENLSSFECISLQQCLRVLGAHPVVVVKPASLDLSHFGWMSGNIGTESFPDDCFKNIGAYSRLLLSEEFYKRFSGYEYILIYQTDAFVFRDELKEWCAKGYDYLGAPWFEQFSSREGEGKFIGVGNGGFSLRKIATHLRVLNTFSYVTPARENYINRFQKRTTGNSILKNIGGFILDHTVRNNTHRLLNNYSGHEDQFWGLSVARKFDWYQVPAYNEATAFAFEMQPRRLFEESGRHLPFGCHAWWKYDLGFWQPHIEQFGYILS